MTDASDNSIEKESDEVIFFNKIFQNILEPDMLYKDIPVGSIFKRTLNYSSEHIVVKTSFGDVVLCYNSSFFKDKIKIIVPEDYLFRVFFRTTTVATMDDIKIITGFVQDYNEKIYPNIHERIKKLEQCFK